MNTRGLSETDANVHSEPEVIATAGDLFPDGSLIDVVRETSDPCRLNLLRWDSANLEISARIEHAGRTYAPVGLDPSIAGAIRWPSGPREFGSTRALFDRVVALVREFCDFPEDNARLFASFVFSTWFPDRLTLVPGLAVLGWDADQRIQLLRLSSCICRRPLELAEFTRAGLLSLPLELLPTMLLARPARSPSVRDLLAVSSYRGLYTAANGRLFSVCCPKIVAFGQDDPLPSASHDLPQIPLPPNSGRCLAISNELQNEIAAEIQGKMLAYRLAHHQKVCSSCVDATHFPVRTRELAASLAACLIDDPEPAMAVVPLLGPQEAQLIEERSLELECAVIESVLSFIHTGSGRETVKTITRPVNAILRSRGSLVAYSPEQVGHSLKRLGFATQRSGAGKMLVFSAETCRHAHDWARTSGMRTYFTGECAYCGASKSAEPQLQGY